MEYKNPALTVDAICLMPLDPNCRGYFSVGPQGILLIKRKNEPFGWSMPGGFCNYNEAAEDAVVREVREETGLEFNIVRQFHTYSDPNRDPRGHMVSVVFVGCATGKPIAADDAKDVAIFPRQKILQVDLAFDHRRILIDYFSRRY